MGEFIARKLILLVLTMFLVSILVFVLVRVIPGDVINIMMGLEGGYHPDRVRAMRTEFGLDKPIHIQFLIWMKDILSGDLGNSLLTGKPVIEDLKTRLPVTFELLAGSLIVSLIIGIPLGVLASLKRNSILESIVQVVGLFGLSVPDFWWGTLLILGVAFFVPSIPTAGYIAITVDPWGNLARMFLPLLTLGFISSAVIMRMTRSAMIEVMESDFIRVLRSKGLGRNKIIFRHALRNALIPVVTVAGIQAGQMLGGAIIIEKLFSLPGVGRFVLDGVLGRDYPIIQVGVLTIAFCFICINALTDILYAAIDPRIRLY